MALEIEVVDDTRRLAVAGVLQATVVVRIDGPSESMSIIVHFKDGGSREANTAAAINAARQTAFRFARVRLNSLRVDALPEVLA